MIIGHRAFFICCCCPTGSEYKGCFIEKHGENRIKSNQLNQVDFKFKHSQSESHSHCDCDTHILVTDKT